MTAANAHAVLTGGAQQIGASLPSATVHAVLWITGAAVLLTAYGIGYRIWRSRRMPVLALPPAECPCCTGRPMESDDCTCPEDCGVTWCQAADPEEEIDVPDWVKRHDSVTDVLAEWEREWNRKKGNDA